MRNFIKIAAFDKRTNANLSLEYGDFVVCRNCGKTMLVNIGTEICPICDRETLEWVDGNEEVSEDFFSNNKQYMLAKERRVG